MKRAGEVVRIAQGLAVLRTPDETHPRMGAELVDESLTTVGRTVDVFGPVDRPYVAVSPTDDVSLPSLVGQVLYDRDAD